ncbi:hypothetical protein [Terrabacter terrigena]|uniref:Uncharacterized protein n=1 Tax=Terrabacter terrigena TaxID=574718 RepID=A0ABW3MY77_9MICO
MVRFWRWLRYQWVRSTLWCEICGEPAMPDMRNCCSEEHAAQAQALSF